MPTLTLLQPRFFLLVCCSEAGRKSKQTSVKKKNNQIPTPTQIWGDYVHKQAYTLHKSLNYLSLHIYMWTFYTVLFKKIHNPVSYISVCLQTHRN